jgi:hypothetical protein
MTKFSNIQKSLKIEVNVAIKILTKCNEDTVKLIAEIEKGLDDSRGIDDSLYAKIVSLSEELVRETHVKIENTFDDEIYVKTFRLNERFSYKPHSNTEEFREYSLREYDNALSGDELTFQWNAHKKGVFKNLKTILEYKTEFLSGRIRYLNTYGNDSRFITLEKHILTPICALTKIDNSWSQFNFDMSGNATSFLLSHIAGVLQKQFERPDIRIDYSHINDPEDVYMALYDLLTSLKYDIEDGFREIFGVKPQSIFEDWMGGPPKYNTKDSESSFEDLSHYIEEFVMQIYSMPEVAKDNFRADEIQSKEEPTADVPEDPSLESESLTERRKLPKNVQAEIIPVPLDDPQEISKVSILFIENPNKPLGNDGVLLLVRKGAQEEHYIRDYRSMGFKDGKRDGSVNSWNLMVEIGRKGGIIKWSDLPINLRRRRIRQLLYDLRNRLRCVFDPEEKFDSLDYITHNDETREYKATFKCIHIRNVGIYGELKRKIGKNTKSTKLRDLINLEEAKINKRRAAEDEIRAMEESGIPPQSMFLDDDIGSIDPD